MNIYTVPVNPRYSLLCLIRNALDHAAPILMGGATITGMHIIMEQKLCNILYGCISHINFN